MKNKIIPKYNKEKRNIECLEIVNADIFSSNVLFKWLSVSLWRKMSSVWIGNFCSFGAYYKTIEMLKNPREIKLGLNICLKISWLTLLRRSVFINDTHIKIMKVFVLFNYPLLIKLKKAIVYDFTFPFSQSFEIYLMTE